MKRYQEFLIESAMPEQLAVITLGRFNPPTAGHEFLFDTITKIAKRNKGDVRIFTGHSQDPRKNPLPWPVKIKFLRKMFPQLGRSIIKEKSIRNIFDALVYLYDQDYNSIVMVVGSDRVSEFERLLPKYNGIEARHGFYEFRNIEVVSAGDRDPDMDTVSGISASKARAAAAMNDLGAFELTMPGRFSGVDELFYAVQDGMGI